MLAGYLANAYLFLALAYIGDVGDSLGIASPSWIAAIAYTVFGVFTWLLVHEYGHRLAGAALGWQCVRFGFGPLEFARTREGWKRERVKMLWGAFVRQMPSSFAHYRREKSITLISGALANVIFAVACGAVALSVRNAVVFPLFGRLAILSFTGVFSLIPHRSGDIASDGYNLWHLRRGGEYADSMQRESLAEASNHTALRHRDWPRDLIKRLAEGSDSYNLFLGYLQSLDAGEVDTASSYMSRLIAQLPEKEPFAYYAYEAAYWLAVYRQDPEAARQWIDRVPPDQVPDLRLRAEAAVALATGQADEAARLAKRALEEQGEIRCGTDLYQTDRLHDLLARLPAATAAAR
ncbi:MAG TPA: M50 family metallopeptidase [Bryobacteraceae bacterium]|nr:M50 family metallopeptidase [Bryobacteraceae bacterium]